MERIVLLCSFSLFVVITSVLCASRSYRVNSTHKEFSCGHQEVIRITTVYRNPLTYCGKDTSTCSWKNTATFPESCPRDSLPQLLYNCNGNNNCSDLLSILNDTMCCNGAAEEPTCRNSNYFDIYFDCVQEQRITSTPNPLTTSNVETPTTEKEKEKTGISEKEKEKTDGSNTMVLIASAVGGGLLLIVTTVLVVCLCKKRQGSVKESTATDSAVDNRQYFNNRNNDALDDDGYYNVLPQNINSNVPQEIDDTYHHIGHSQNRPVVNDVDDTYNHIGGLREDTSNRQAARNDHNDVDDTYNHIGGLSTSNRQAARNDHHMEEQAMGGNSSNDEATYTAVVKNVSGKVTGQRRVINEDEDDKTYAEVNKKK